MERERAYQKMGYKTQTLLDKLYGTHESYLNTKHIHPLEPYITLFDIHQDTESLVRAIGYRIGIYIEVNDVRADELFFDNMLTMIDNLPKEFPPGYPKLQDIIDMDISEFLDWFDKRGISYDEEDHMDRLTAFVAFYNKRTADSRE